VLAQLPSVNHATLRCVLSHLVDVCAHSDVNKASVTNVARVFGPTLMNARPAAEAPTPHAVDPLAAFTYGQTELQIGVLYDLVTHYNELFDVTEREMVARHRVNECASRILPDLVAHHVRLRPLACDQ